MNLSHLFLKLILLKAAAEQKRLMKESNLSLKAERNRLIKEKKILLKMNTDKILMLTICF